MLQRRRLIKQRHLAAQMETAQLRALHQRKVRLQCSWGKYALQAGLLHFFLFYLKLLQRAALFNHFIVKKPQLFQQPCMVKVKVEFYRRQLTAQFQTDAHVLGLMACYIKCKAEWRDILWSVDDTQITRCHVHGYFRWLGLGDSLIHPLYPSVTFKLLFVYLCYTASLWLWKTWICLWGKKFRNGRPIN